MEASGGRRCKEGNWAMGSRLQRAQWDSRFNGCSEVGPPTDRSHCQRPGLEKSSNTGRLCQHVGVKPHFALACKCDDLPFTVTGTGRARWSLALLQQQSHWDPQPSPASGLLVLFTPAQSWHNERDEEAEECLWRYKDNIDTIPLCQYHSEAA